MTTNEYRHGVWLGNERVGTLNQRGDYTWFSFTAEYLENPRRAVLGLSFEENLRARRAQALRLPPWFSNLLPEGKLREWIARSRGVSVAREMELLAQVGRDLPGAVRVLPEDEPPDVLEGESLGEVLAASGQDGGQDAGGWRFSLSGVGLKFSMVRSGDRLTLPAHGQGGNWIVKLPDSLYQDVPRNEHAMMTLAGLIGIDVPEHALVPLEQLAQLPERLVLQAREHYAYAVRRFDRAAHKRRVHVEDFAQVRNFYPERKYDGTFETVAALTYRRRDLASLYEFTRRLTFNILISNGDAHLKNWSLIYPDKRNPKLAPAYDLVSTEFYRAGEGPEDLGLRFGRSRRFESISLWSFERLEEKLGASRADLAGCARETVDRVTANWPTVAGLLDDNQPLRDAVSRSIEDRRRSLIGCGRAPCSP